VRGLIRTSPAAGASLLLGGLAIAGAPPLAVFLSEFLILKAGLAEGRFVTVGLLTLFIAIAFFGVLLHINRMVFGRPANGTSTMPDAPAQPSHRTHHQDGYAVSALALPHSCAAILLAAGALVVALGIYLPGPLQQLLQIASATLHR